MRFAYFDLASGISGDMFIAALADAGRAIGVDVSSVVSDAISSLDLGCTVTFVDDERGGLACLRAEVKTGDGAHSAAELRQALEHADVAAPVRRRALAGIDALVRAEANVHNVAAEDVHLHELGSSDTAADLIGAAAALHSLDVSEVGAAPVPVPSGWISSGHGELPLPAPVTLQLLKGATVRGFDEHREVVTPTGAAILAASEATFGPLPMLELAAVGIGGGTRNTERPNICRVLLGARAHPSGAHHESCVLMETNIDDQTPESVGHAVESLIRDGALDAWITPIVMKKSRPAFLLSVLVRPEDETRIAEQIFRDTTTLGIRRRETVRWALERSEIVVRVRGHSIRAKIGRLRDDIVKVAPEFQDCVAASKALDLPVNDLLVEAAAAARRALGCTD